MKRHDEVSHLPAVPHRNGSYEDHVMATKALPSQEVLRQLLRYEPETGKLFWLPRDSALFAETTRSANGTANTWNAKHAGKEAFTYKTRCGYLRGRLFHGLFAAHRVIFKIAHGIEPAVIDHVNRDRSDNRIENLRAATGYQNSANSADRPRKSSTFRGVYRADGEKTWRAAIRDPMAKKRVHIGCFESEAAAALAYDKQAKLHYGAFARLNFPALCALEARHDQN